MDINGPVGTDLTGTATLIDTLYVNNEPIRIGVANVIPYGYYDGLMDEIVIFNDVITAAEATQISKGSYGITPQGAYLGDLKLDHNVLGSRGLSK